MHAVEDDDMTASAAMLPGIGNHRQANSQEAKDALARMMRELGVDTDGSGSEDGWDLAEAAAQRVREGRAANSSRHHLPAIAPTGGRALIDAFAFASEDGSSGDDSHSTASGSASEAERGLDLVGELVHRAANNAESEEFAWDSQNFSVEHSAERDARPSGCTYITSTSSLMHVTDGAPDTVMDEDALLTPGLLPLIPGRPGAPSDGRDAGASQAREQLRAMLGSGSSEEEELDAEDMDELQRQSRTVQFEVATGPPTGPPPSGSSSPRQSAFMLPPIRGARTPMGAGFDIASTESAESDAEPDDDSVPAGSAVQYSIPQELLDQVAVASVQAHEFVVESSSASDEDDEASDAVARMHRRAMRD